MAITETIEKKFRNIDLEYQIANFIFNKPKNIGSIRFEWFTVDPIITILRCIQKYKAALSKTMLLQELKTRKILTKENIETYRTVIDKIMEVERTLHEHSFSVAVKQLTELYDSRFVLKGLQDIVQDIKNFDVEKAKRKLKDISKSTTKHIDNRTGEWTQDFEQRVTVVQERAAMTDENGTSIVGIPTGIKSLDSIISGVLPGEFGIIAGRPSLGKTATLVNLATNAYVNGYNVLFATGEMPKLDIEFRIDANLAGIPANEFRIGNVSKEHMKQWKNTIDRFKATSSCFLEVCAFPRNFDTGDLEEACLHAQDKHEKPVQLICVDYINIMRTIESHGGTSSRDWEAQAGVVWDFKGFISDFNGGIAGWSAGQIKDEAFEQDQLDLTCLKYARAISETAPIVLGLVQTPDDELEGRIQVQVLKMRNAKRLDRPIFLHPNMDLMRMHDHVMQKKSLLCLENELGERHKPKAHKAPFKRKTE